MVHQWPPGERGQMLNIILDADPCRAVWASAVTIAWLTGSHAVISGARNRRNLLLWLDYARLNAPFPFLSPLFANVLDELPETLTVFRGGVVGAVQPLEEGHSWTLRPAVGCAYATLRALELGLPAIVIEATIGRSAIKAASRARDQEIVLIEPPTTARPHLDDPAEIARLGEAEVAGRRPVPLANGLNLDVRDHAGWHGWG
jgi:hypothetical protein